MGTAFQEGPPVGKAHSLLEELYRERSGVGGAGHGGRTRLEGRQSQGTQDSVAQIQTSF